LDVATGGAGSEAGPAVAPVLPCCPIGLTPVVADVCDSVIEGVHAVCGCAVCQLSCRRCNAVSRDSVAMDAFALPIATSARVDPTRSSVSDHAEEAAYPTHACTVTRCHVPLSTASYPPLQPPHIVTSFAHEHAKSHRSVGTDSATAEPGGEAHHLDTEQNGGNSPSSPQALRAENLRNSTRMGGGGGLGGRGWAVVVGCNGREGARTHECWATNAVGPSWKLSSIHRHVHFWCWADNL
jgi:hypothetical protein